MPATYKDNCVSFLVLKVQSVKLCGIYLRLCHIAIASSKAHNFLQFSLIFSVIKIRYQVKNRTNCRRIINFCKNPRPIQNCKLYIMTGIWANQ